MSEPKRKRLGEILLDQNLILPEHVEEALEKQKKSGRRLGQVFVDMGLLTHDQLAGALSRQAGTPHVWLRKGLIDPKIVDILSREKCDAYSVIPMFKVQKTLTLAMVDCEAIFDIDDIETLTGCKVQAVQCREDDIQTAIERYYGEDVQRDDFLESFQETDVQVIEAHFEGLEMVEEMAEGAKIINLVNIILLDAIKGGASDIHIEPDASVTRIRYRIDGALQEVMTALPEHNAAIVSRVKVIAKMDIAERRMPQDGRFHVRAEDREVDVRVSSMPTVLGEKIVMRVLDKGKLRLDINQIGFCEESLESMKKLLKRPNGIILVTGPTGSGKTTTLYSGLSYIRSIERNIVTIEDPVEYQLELINQTQVNDEYGLSFAKTLRSVLRQDPDVIMVGEIRDRETAEVAIQAALTGHLVVSTLHTGESAGTIARLVEMGIEPYLLSSAVIGIVSQRLVRLVCKSCRTNYFPEPSLLERIGWEGLNVTFVTGKGCEECFDSGLRGRTSIMELLEMNEELSKTILLDASLQSVKAYATRRGLRTLKDEAFRLVEEQRTSLEEVMRVVFVEESDEQSRMTVTMEAR